MPTGPGPGRVIANPIGVAWLGDPEESPVGVALLRVDSLDVLGAVVRQAEVIMAASAPAGGALVASRPVWTPVVAASETPDPAVQDGDPAQRQPQFLGGRQHQPRHHI
jgi:hypothetical protein